MRTVTPPPVRFWRKVQKTDTCWLWTAAKDRGGYGCFAAESRPTRMVKAHRFAYEDVLGPIPDGLDLDHLCRVPSCVNPAHLEPVTRGENVLRGFSRPAQQARMQLCAKGHEFSVWGNGSRYCRTCRNAWVRNRAAQKREMARAERMVRE